MFSPVQRVILSRGTNLALGTEYSVRYYRITNFITEDGHFFLYRTGSVQYEEYRNPGVRIIAQDRAIFIRAEYEG